MIRQVASKELVNGVALEIQKPKRARRGTRSCRRRWFVRYGEAAFTIDGWAVPGKSTFKVYYGTQEKIELPLPLVAFEKLSDALGYVAYLVKKDLTSPPAS